MSGHDYDIERARMLVDQIDHRTVRDGRVGIYDPQVLNAMALVPRHEFVPPAMRSRAYADHPLPIGYDQTISQPYIVAFMTEVVRPNAGDRALEVGTGSGYQAAVLAEIVSVVHSVEIIEPLGREAAVRLKKLRYDNVTVHIGDGYQGLPDEAPFDVILVTAAAPHVPEALLAQLAPGGRMCIPVESTRHGMSAQELLFVSKDTNGVVHQKEILPVRFVPLLKKQSAEKDVYVKRM